MNDCPKLWLKHYEHQTDVPHPSFVDAYILTRASMAKSDPHGARGHRERRNPAHVAVIDSPREETFQCSTYEESFGVAAMSEEVHFYDLEDPSSVGGTSLMVLEPPPEPQLESLDELVTPTRIDIPNHLIYMNKGQGRYIVDVVVDGVPCKALIDSGAGVTGISKDFYSRSAIPTRPSPLRPMACRSVTGEVMNTTQLLKDVSFTLGGFHSKESFLLLPISRAYETLIGMDFMVRNKMIVNCDPQAMCHLSLVSTRPAHDIASILPMWSEDCGVLDGVHGS